MTRPQDTTISTCECCAKPVTYDLIIPDDAWARISPRPVEGWKGGGVLCPECIVTTLIAERDGAIENERMATECFSEANTSLRTAEAQLKAGREALARADHALMVVQVAIDEDTTALNDCLWIPERFGPNESVLDFVGSVRATLSLDTKGEQP